MVDSIPKKQFIVQGMHCASCALTIERALKNVPGVENATVNFASEKAVVQSGDSVSTTMLREAVAKTGYKLLPDTDNVLEHHSHNDEKGEKSDAQNKHDHHKLMKEAEIQSLWVRFLIGAIFSLAVVILSLPDYFPIRIGLDREMRFLILLILTAPVEFWVGLRFWRGAWSGFKNFRANMDTLVVLGTGAAFFFSATVTFLEIRNWVLEIPAGGGLDVYFDVAAVVTTLVVLGKFLEAKAKGRASEAIKKLLKLQAKTAHVLHDGKQETEVPIEEVQVGDIVLVKPGEKIPVDGIILEGETTIDESMVTGESLPVDKKADAKVIGATINKTGAFTFRAEKVGGETFLAQIIKLVEEAQGSKAPIQKFADTIMAYFVPVVLVIAVAAFVLGWIFGPDPSLTFGLINAVAILVVACPCALGLATPTAIMVGTGKAAELGIIIRDAEALETAGKVDAIILDKTGTITRGEPAVTDVLGGDEVIATAASLEKFSEHPVAQAVVSYAASLEKKSSHPLDTAVSKKTAEAKTKILEVRNFRAHPGKGIEGEVLVSGEWQKMFLGNITLLSDLGIAVQEPMQKKVFNLESEGKTMLFLARPNVLIGAIAVADTLKEGAEKAIAELEKLGLEVWLITGDNERTAEAIGRTVGIKNIMARVLPHEKSNKVRELQSIGKKIAMVGDGINDAPALTQADVGIAIGTGTDIAIESGDITLISGDPRGISEAVRLSRRTMENIKQNLFWASIYNLVLIPLAAGALYPFLGITLNPIFAGAAMAMSSVSVVLNSLRLKRMKF